MDTLKIGSIITGEQHKDAVHMAVAPVTAATDLEPGQHIGVNIFGHGDPEVARRIGIVDPFLMTGPRKGERFWLFLYPGSITSLRHEWTHAAFPAEHAPARKDMSTSEAWLRTFADGCGMSYETLMRGAARWVEHWEHLCLGGLLEGVRVPSEFWEHYEAVSGTAVEDGRKDDFFTCSC